LQLHDLYPQEPNDGRMTPTDLCVAGDENHPAYPNQLPLHPKHQAYSVERWFFVLQPHK